IALLGHPINFANICAIGNLLFLHLQPYEFTLQGDIPQMMSVGHLDDNGVTGCEIKSVDISEEVLSTVLEADLNDVKSIFSRHIHIGQPVEYIHLITTAGTTGAVVLTTRDLVTLG